MPVVVPVPMAGAMEGLSLQEVHPSALSHSLLRGYVGHITAAVEATMTTVRLAVSLVGANSEAAASALMLQRCPTRATTTAVRFEAPTFSMRWTRLNSRRFGGCKL